MMDQIDEIRMNTKFSCILVVVKFLYLYARRCTENQCIFTLAIVVCQNIVNKLCFGFIVKTC